MPELSAAIAERFDFDRWSGTNALGRGLFVRNYRIPPPAPGWELARAWNVPALEDMPPALQTVWRDPSAAQPDALVRIDVYECASRPAAHALMVRLLGEHQVANVSPVTQGELGDVHASGGDGATAVFARGNLVIFVARAGAEPSEALAIAARVDADIVEEPVPELGRAAIAPERAETFKTIAAADSIGTTIPLDVDADQQEAMATMPVTTKIFADGAEVTNESGRLALIVTDPTRVNAVIYTLPADDGPSRFSTAKEHE
jgi:hypothetical protein